MTRRGAVTRCLATAVVVALVVVLGTAPAAEQRPDATAPRRIVSVVPAVTEMLFAIGAGDAVVGVSSYDTFPPEVATKPKVGALVDPDFERILTLRPDLVVAYGTQQEFIARLTRANIPVFRYEHAGLPDVVETIARLGARIGRADDAHRLAARIDADLEAVRRSVAGRPRPRTVLLFGREPGALRSIYASGGVGFMHDLLVVAGGEDVFSDVGRQSLQASTETLLQRAPEVIVEAHAAGDWPAARIEKERAVWGALPALPAVQRGRIYILADNRLSVPGPRVAEAARLLADVLHPGRPGR